MSNSSNKIAVNLRRACTLMFEEGLTHEEVTNAIISVLKRPAEGLVYVDDVYKYIKEIKNGDNITHN